MKEAIVGRISAAAAQGNRLLRAAGTTAGRGPGGAPGNHGLSSRVDSREPQGQDGPGGRAAGPPAGSSAEQQTAPIDFSISGPTVTVPGAGALAPQRPAMPASPAPAKPLPEVIAGYRRGRLLGTGGMAQVFEARHLQLDRVVALKLLKAQVADDADFSLRFLRESHAMAAVTHANVVAIYDAGESEGLLYMALEYVPGGDLQRLLKRRGVLPTEEALGLIAGCARGVKAISEAGLVHRDIKPQNIFLARDGQPKIGDLGLARAADGGDRMTLTGNSWGTPVFMSPEQIRGIADIDTRTDIYALGATLFTLLTGAEPFSGPTAFVITHQVLSEPAPDPRMLNKTIPAEVAALIAKAMAKDRDKRYRNADELLEDLERARSGQRLLHAAARPLEGTPPPPPGAGAAPAPRRGGSARAAPAAHLDPLMIKLGALVATILLLYGVWYSLQGAIAAPAHDARDLGWPAGEGRDQAGAWRELAVGAARARFRYCPAGTFAMGSPKGEAGRDEVEVAHQVTISHGFWLMDSECTQALYREVTGKNPSRHQGDDLPVEQVTWDEAGRFCAALNARIPRLAARLPTEAEWEYACRAGGSGPFDDGSAAEAQGWFAQGALADAWRGETREARETEARRLADGNAELTTHQVRRLKPNRWGLYDMHGNVQEWCSDAWDGLAAYSELPLSDPLGATGRFSICRGGSWFQAMERARAAARSGRGPREARDDLGFRVALDAAAAP
jgi:formylglycine-generating enzyme required for sulfatase activity/tRNA A-37 threonylcarbamoyl transferase component Bud32